MEECNAEELAWVAGFFDGEGHVSKHGYQFVANVTQADRQPLDRIASTVGIGIVRGPYVRTSRPNNKPYYTWTISNPGDCMKFYDLIRPYLCQPKIDQWEAVIAKHKEPASAKYPRNRKISQNMS